MNNPFVEHREIFFAEYRIAVQLRKLVLNLYNCTNSANVGEILAYGDRKERVIAIECCAWYSQYGEDCKEFMALARELCRIHHWGDEE